MRYCMGKRPGGRYSYHERNQPNFLRGASPLVDGSRYKLRLYKSWQGQVRQKGQSLAQELGSLTSSSPENFEFKINRSTSSYR